MIHEVRWDITGKCNLNCVHCQAAIFYSSDMKRKDLLTEDVIIVIQRLKRAGVRKIGLLGGEPLMRNDIMEILKYLKKVGISVTINTNLLLLDKVDVNELLENVDGIFVSIDGTCEEEHERIRGKNTFEKTITNIKKLIKSKNNTMIEISYVINKNNYKSTAMIYDFMKDLKVDACLVDAVHKVGNADTNWNGLELTLEQEIEAVKNLISSWNFQDSMILNLRMYTNRFRDYLEKVTGIYLEDKLVWDAPGKTSFYILNDGTLVPTQFMAYMRNDKFLSKSLRDFELEEIIKNDSFIEFLDLYKKNLPKNYYEPCRFCQYCGKQCNPSPVSYWLGEKIPIELCAIK